METNVNKMADNIEDCTPLLAEEGGVRHRDKPSVKSETPNLKTWSPKNDPDLDDSLPYGGKVYLARKKKPDPLYIKIIEVILTLYNDNSYFLL